MNESYRTNSTGKKNRDQMYQEIFNWTINTHVKTNKKTFLTTLQFHCALWTQCFKKTISRNIFKRIYCPLQTKTVFIHFYYGIATRLLRGVWWERVDNFGICLRIHNFTFLLARVAFCKCICLDIQWFKASPVQYITTEGANNLAECLP